MRIYLTCFARISMQALLKQKILFIFAVAPFLAGLVASVHVHSYDHQESKKSHVSSCCCSHTHQESKDSWPSDSQDDCDDCILCHFSAQSSWFQPVAIEVDLETISNSASQLDCGLMIQQVPVVYRGRAPPAIFSV